MITYDPLWKTMKKKGITTYTLIKEYSFSRGTLDSPDDQFSIGAGYHWR